MYDSLLCLLQKPRLWQRSAAPFWDDDHISKGMLEAHLNPALDAASRRMETIDRSVAWLRTQLPAGGRVLDLGCGPGLYTARLSACGYAVTGMDYARRSIDYARAHDPATAYVCQNYLELNAVEAYDAITLIYCDYAALTAPERQRLLGRVFRALKPGGRFVLDVFTDAYFHGHTTPKTWSLHENGGFYAPVLHACLEATYFYESDTVQARQVIVLTADGATEHIIWDTAYTRQRLADELALSGLQMEATFDDVCGAPYTGTADTLCGVAVRRPG